MKQVTLCLGIVLLATAAIEVFTLPNENQGDNKPLEAKLHESALNLNKEFLLPSNNGDESQVQKATDLDVYIVVFKKEAADEEIDLHKKMVIKTGNVGPILHEYNITNDFRGYSAPMTKHDAEKIQNHSTVKYVVKNKDGQGNDWYCPNSRCGAPWGIVRSSNKNFDANVFTSYLYSNDGTGSNVYVIDSGIDTSHPDFNGRAIWGTNTIDSLHTDDQGHGTHVAGTIISSTYGVASGATAIAVRTCHDDKKGGVTCPGSQTVSAINWVADQHKQGSKSVINFSLGWKGGWQPADDAIQAAINKGIHVIASAGDIGVDACTQSPARVADVVTVGAINITNGANYNYGSCVNISAPGVNIKSTLPNRAYGTKSGTSMAAAHVAGAIAVILQHDNLTPEGMAKRLTDDVAIENQIQNLKSGTPNKILFIPCY